MTWWKAVVPASAHGLMLMLLLAGGSTARAEFTPGDFDGGGRSDLSSVIVDKRSNTTAWVVRSSETGQLSSYSFHVAGDALVTGRFYGGNLTYPGLVWVRDAKKPLEWYIKNPNGTENFLLFGLPGDTIPNQGDLDCDGKTDLLAVRNERGVMVWYVNLTGSPGVIFRDVFGVTGDKVATADMDGDGCAEEIVLRSGFTWFAKKLGAPSFSTVQWGLPGDIPLLPQDVNHDGVAEYVIARPNGSTQTAFIRLSNGTANLHALGLDSSIPLLGNFIGDPGFAWFQRNQGLVGVEQYQPGSPAIFGFGAANQWIVRPDGTVITPSENGRFGTVVGNPGGPLPSDQFQCDRFVKLPDGRGGNKYNARNSRHAAKLIWNSSLAGEIDHVSGFVDGVFFSKFHSMGYEIGGRPWWNSDKGIGSFDADKPLTAVAYLTDNSTICMYIPNPQQTLD